MDGYPGLSKFLSDKLDWSWTPQNNSYKGKHHVLRCVSTAAWYHWSTVQDSGSLTDTNRALLCTPLYLVAIQSPVSFRLHIRTAPNLIDLVGQPCQYGNQLRIFPLFNDRLSYYFAHPKRSSLAAFWYKWHATWFRRARLLPRGLPRSHFSYLHLWCSLIRPSKHWTNRSWLCYLIAVYNTSPSLWSFCICSIVS